MSRAGGKQPGKNHHRPRRPSPPRHAQGHYRRSRLPGGEHRAAEPLLNLPGIGFNAHRGAAFPAEAGKGRASVVRTPP